MSEQRLEHRRLGTDTTRAAQFHTAHFKQTYTLMEDAEPLRDIVHARVEGEKSSDSPRLRACALFDERVHLGDGFELRAQLGWEPQRACETWTWVYIHRQNLTALVRVRLGEQCRERCLAHTTFTSNCDFHGLFLS